MQTLMKKYFYKQQKILIALCMIMPLKGQDAEQAQEEKPPMARVAVMAYGYVAPNKFRIATEEDVQRLAGGEDGIDDNGDSIADQIRGNAVLIPKEEGTFPPSSLELPLTEKQLEEGVAPGALRVGFNNVSSQVDVFANVRLDLNKKGEKDAYIQMPALREDSDNLLLLVPRGEAPKYWIEKPRVIHYDFSSEKYVGKNFVFKNLTRTEVQLELHDEKVMLKAGGTHTFKDIPTGKSILYRVSTNKGKSVIEYTRLVLYDKKLLIQLMLPQHKEIKNGKRYRLAKLVFDRPTLPTAKEDLDAENKTITSQ